MSYTLSKRSTRSDLVFSTGSSSLPENYHVYGLIHKLAFNNIGTFRFMLESCKEKSVLYSSVDLTSTSYHCRWCCARTAIRDVLLSKNQTNCAFLPKTIIVHITRCHASGPMAFDKNGTGQAAASAILQCKQHVFV